MDLYRVTCQETWTVDTKRSYDTTEKTTVLAKSAEHAISKVRSKAIGNTIRLEGHDGRKTWHIHKCVAVKMLGVEPIIVDIDIT